MIAYEPFILSRESFSASFFHVTSCVNRRQFCMMTILGSLKSISAIFIFLPLKPCSFNPLKPVFFFYPCVNRQQLRMLTTLGPSTP